MLDTRELRQRLIDELRSKGLLRSPRVAEAFATVPRHLFLPDESVEQSYTDRAFATKLKDGVPISSSSQPSIMAVMLEQLQVRPGHRVLEVGAGTGYNAALLADLVGAGGALATIDIDRDIAEAASRRLRRAGHDNVRVLTGDGALGHAADAPYDRIIVTAGCWQLYQPWIDQLEDRGLLVAPLRLNSVDISLALRKEGRVLSGHDATGCGFIPLRGSAGHKYDQMATQNLRVFADGAIDDRTRSSLAHLLAHERQVDFAFPRLRDDQNSPLYYLLLQGRPAFAVAAQTGDDRWHAAPLLMTSDRSAVALEYEWNHEPAQATSVRLFGAADALEFLRESLVRWQSEGQPDLRDLRTRVQPSSADYGRLPRPVNGRYRFTRGAHDFELWFDR